MKTAVSAASGARHTALALIDADVTFKPHKTTTNGGKERDDALQSQARKSNKQMNSANRLMTGASGDIQSARSNIVNICVLPSVPHLSEQVTFDRRADDSTKATGAHHVAAALVTTPEVQNLAQDQRDEQLASATTLLLDRSFITTATPRTSLADSGVTSQSTLSSNSTTSLDGLRLHPVAGQHAQSNSDDASQVSRADKATRPDASRANLQDTAAHNNNGGKYHPRRIDSGKIHSCEHWRSTIVLAEACTEGGPNLSMHVAAGSAAPALQLQASVNDLASGYTTKRLEASENEVQITSAKGDRPSAALINRSGNAHNAPHPQTQAHPPANALATTPRTLKSLSNIKATSSSFALATSASSKAPNGNAHSESATVGNSEKAEIEERRRNFIMEAHRKLQHDPSVEMREFGRKSSLAHMPSNLPQLPLEPDAQHSSPTPATTQRPIVPAKSESHLRQLLRSGAQKQRGSVEKGQSLTPTRKDQNTSQQSWLTQRESHSHLHTPECATKQLEAAHWSLHAHQRQDSANYALSPSHDSLIAEPHNAGRGTLGLNMPSACSTPLGHQSCLSSSALSYVSQFSKQPAKSHMLFAEVTQQPVASGVKAKKQETNTQQNALSVMNLSVTRQTNRSEPQQFMSTSSCTLLPDESQSVVFSTRSAASHASTSNLRRTTRNTVVKRNVCIQCNMTRAPPIVRDLKPVRKSPTLSQILQYYELVTFRLQCDSGSHANVIDYGVRLFESCFVDFSSTDAPWSINGKRPVLAVENSAFIKVVRPQIDRDRADLPACSLLAIDFLRENSIAHCDGRLCVGDYVVEVNGKLLLNQELPEAAEKLVNSSYQLVIVVARSPQRNRDEQRTRPADKCALSSALQLELEMLKARYDRLKGEMKRNEVLIHEMRNAVARKVKVKQLVSTQTTDPAPKARSQNAFKTIYLEEQLVHVI